MKKNVSIIRVEPYQLTELQSISIQTFEESFSAFNSAEDMGDYLSNNLSLAKLSDEFNAPESEFYFAYMDGELAGYLKLNYQHCVSGPSENAKLEIERIYIRRIFQRKHIGQDLLDKAKKRAIELGCNQIVLGVWEHNHGAISFYERNGFIPIGSQIFMLGKDRQTDILMRLLYPFDFFLQNGIESNCIRPE